MQSQNEYTYLDEDPQEIKPYEFEVPILHMAIIDVSGILIIPFKSSGSPSFANENLTSY